MGVGVQKISREAATGPRKKIVTMILFQRTPSLALRLPRVGDHSSYGFWGSKKIE
jgi:hypothetical protein